MKSELDAALELVRDGFHRDALEVLRAAHGRSDTDTLEIRRLIAVCEDALGDPAAAAHTCRELVDDFPNRPDLWRELARAERRNDDPIAAARAMRQYLVFAADDATAWASLGDFLDDAGDESGADAAWRRAIALDPGDPTVHYNRGVAAGRRKDLACVRRCVEALRARDPDDPLGLALSSIVLEDEGRVWQGWEAMRAAVTRESDPARGLALAHRTLLYAERNEIIEPARELGDELHARALLDEDVLEIVNRIEQRSTDRAHDFSVVVDAAPDPRVGAAGLRYQRWTRVVAETAAEAEGLAIAFERRCGGREVEVVEIEDRGAVPARDHVGVWRCQGSPDLYSP